MKLSAPIYILKHQAKALARKENVRLHQALNQIASREGFSSWSHLTANWSPEDLSVSLFTRLQPGDFVLIGARPAQGKTILSIGLAIEAMTRGNRAAFFTLDFTRADVVKCFVKLKHDINHFDGLFVLDVSENICADYVVSRMASAPPNTLIVIDYLQLLDQRRDNPSLMNQTQELKRFATERQMIVVCLSQISRGYEAASKPYPDLADVRLPNPLDLSLFDKACFLSNGEMQLISPVSQSGASDA